MKILTYSPSIEAYVAVTGKGGEVSYYDLSSDITSATITRNVDTNSTFNITLQNKNGKYNNVFTPMDKIVIYLTKTERERVLTGYIRTVTAFTLYPSNFTLSGSCTLHQLQSLFWDPQLAESNILMQMENSSSVDWDNFNTVLSKLLIRVGGWDANRVKIGSMPQQVIQWAQQMYEAKIQKIDQVSNMVNDFYKMLQTSGPQLGSSAGGYGGVGGGTASAEAVEKAVQWMIEKANTGKVVYSQSNRNIKNPDGWTYDCSSFVITGFYVGGIDVNAGYTGNMRSGFTAVGFTWIPGTSFDASQLQRGDILLNEQLHTQVYIGNGQDVNCGSTPAKVTNHSVNYGGKGWNGVLRYTG